MVEAYNSLMQWSDEYENYANAPGDTKRRYYNTLSQKTAAFMHAREAFHKELFKNPPPPKYRNTPSQLNANKVSLPQICYEWRWLNEDGTPDVDRAIREIDRPGSELTEAVIAARHQWDLLQIGFVLPEDDNESEPEFYERALPPPSPAVVHASVEELVRQRVSVGQIVKLKAAELGITDESALHKMEVAVRAVAEMLGINPEVSLDSTVTPSTLAKSAKTERLLQEVN